MEFKHQCSNCEFNFNGVCAGNRATAGKKITDNTQCCDDWSADLDYFTYECTTAPRFLREKYRDCSLSYAEFSAHYADYRNGVNVPINIFDAIKHIYGLSIVDIAVLADVTYGVVFQAKNKRIPQKRIQQFCDVLYISKEVLLSNSTAVFDELHRGKNLLFAQAKTTECLSANPEWKQKIASLISNEYLRCPIHLANKFARIDRLFWSSNMSLDEYTDSEKAFIQYCLKHYKNVSHIEYSLDMMGLPHISIEAA